MPGELEQTSSNCDVLGNQAWRTITGQLTIVTTVGRLCLLDQSSCPSCRMNEWLTKRFYMPITFLRGYVTFDSIYYVYEQRKLD